MPVVKLSWLRQRCQQQMLLLIKLPSKEIDQVTVHAYSREWAEGEGPSATRPTMAVWLSLISLLCVLVAGYNNASTHKWSL